MTFDSELSTHFQVVSRAGSTSHDSKHYNPSFQLTCRPFSTRKMNVNELVLLFWLLYSLSSDGFSTYGSEKLLDMLPPTDSVS